MLIFCESSPIFLLEDGCLLCKLVRHFRFGPFNTLGDLLRKYRTLVIHHPLTINFLGFALLSMVCVDIDFGGPSGRGRLIL